jgi:nitroreductase
LDALDAIYARRSIRSFEERPVEPEKLNELARLAMAAPSAMNRRPWEIVIVNEPEGMNAIRRALRFCRYNAPAAVVMCGNRLRGLPAGARDFWVQDCAAAMENLLVGATAMGLGTVWLGVYPLKGSMERISAELGLPSHVVPLGVAYVGYPAEEKEPRTQYRPEWVHAADGRRGPRESDPRDEVVIRTAMDVIRSRRSIRKYTGEPVGDEQIRSLLEAGFCAPTARNLRPWRFLVMRDAAVLEAIRRVCPNAAMLPQAGCGIVVCGDRERQPETAIWPSTARRPSKTCCSPPMRWSWVPCGWVISPGPRGSKGCASCWASRTPSFRSESSRWEIRPRKSKQANGTTRIAFTGTVVASLRRRRLDAS